MKIGIVGLGVVGTVTENILKSKYKINRLDPNKGYNDDLSKCDIIFICINEKDPTMKNLDKLIDDLVKINTKAIFVIRTTVIPGTTNRYIKTYNRDFVFMPEFIREWNVEYDTFHPDKIVIGTEDIDIWGILYGMFLHLIEANKVIKAKPVEAEIAKLALNSLALIKVVYAEQLFDIAKKYNCNYKNIYRIFHLDQNINERHLLAGNDGYRGAGGKCLQKDIEFLCDAAKKTYVNIPLMDLARELNIYYLKINQKENCDD